MKNSTNTDIGLFILRLAFGGLMLGHGWGKMMKLFSGGDIQFFNFMGIGMTESLALAVFAEIICALLIIFGLFTRWATIPLIITMLVAVLIVHGDHPFKKQEPALLYALAYLSLLFTGPGEYSLDARFRWK